MSPALVRRWGAASGQAARPPRRPAPTPPRVPLSRLPGSPERCGPRGRSVSSSFVGSGLPGEGPVREHTVD